MNCSVHHGPIKGKAFRWNHRVMCGRCYRYFTSHVRIVPGWKPQRPARPLRVRASWLTRLVRRLA